MFIFLRLAVTLLLLWAVVGPFLYGYLLDYLGWNGLSVELKWTLFVGLSLVLAVIAAAFLIAVLRLLTRIWHVQ
jgi:uncharacterized membrane protein YdcZ (DUF606 family)